MKKMEHKKRTCLDDHLLVIRVPRQQGDQVRFSQVEAGEESKSGAGGRVVPAEEALEVLEAGCGLRREGVGWTERGREGVVERKKRERRHAYFFWARTERPHARLHARPGHALPGQSADGDAPPIGGEEGGDHGAKRR
jgi:hypothetical protein